LLGRDDGFAQVEPLLSRVPDWAGFLGNGAGDEFVERLRKHQTTGRPLGTDSFVARLEEVLGRPLRPGKAGRRPTKICMVSPNCY
jgi:putative transposase